MSSSWKNSSTSTSSLTNWLEEHLSSAKQTVLVVTLVGIILAIVIGILVASTSYLYIAWGVVLVLAILVMTGMKERSWILILLFWAFFTRTVVFSVPFSLRDISILMGGASFFVYRALTGATGRRPWQPLDLVVMVNLVWVMITFMIHPVGLLIFESERIGGRALFDIGMAAVAYLTIWGMAKNLKTVAHIPVFLAIGGVFLSFIHLTRYIFPSLPAHLPYLYGAFDVETLYVFDLPIQGIINRWEGLSYGGLSLVLLLCAYYPSRTLVDPTKIRSYLLVLAFVGLFAAGYRSKVVEAGAAIFIAALLRKQLRDLIPVTIVGCTLMGILLFGQGRMYELPLTVQRSLSFLPGEWNPEVVVTAKASNARWEWWAEIVKNNEIKNWWIGDGFGANMRDLTFAILKGSPKELFTLTGGYHNGPLTTIRFVGVVGLVLFYALIVYAAVVAVRCVRRCQGTILEPAAMYLGIQFVYTPLSFTFIFGGYNSQLPDYILWAGLLLVVMWMRGRLPDAEPKPVPVRMGQFPQSQLTLAR